MIKKYPFFFLLIFLLLCTSSLTAKETFYLEIIPKLNGQKLKLDSNYHSKNGNLLKIAKLKFYISGIELLQDSTIKWKEKESYHLIDALDSKSFLFQANIPNNLKFNSLKLNLGIDSITNSSGIKGNQLDPTNAMYWTWQNGYINFKLEGKSSFSSSNDSNFTYHLGGYNFPNNALQSIVFNCEKLKFPKIDKKNARIFSIELNLDVFLNSEVIRKQAQIMTPCKEAVEISKIISKQFELNK